MSDRIARLTKDFHYLEIAKTVSKRSTCINKQFGAVIVQHDRIVSTGYNGSPMKCINCSDVGRCRRLEDPNYQRGITSYRSKWTVCTNGELLHAGARKAMGL